MENSVETKTLAAQSKALIERIRFELIGDRDRNGLMLQTPLLPWKIGPEVKFGRDEIPDSITINGWHSPEENFSWITGQNSQLAFSLTHQEDLLLTIDAMPFGLRKHLSLTANDFKLGSFPLENRCLSRAILPKHLFPTEETPIILNLDANAPQRPSDLGPSKDKRLLAIAVYSIRIEPLGIIFS